MNANNSKILMIKVATAKAKPAPFDLGDFIYKWYIRIGIAAVIILTIGAWYLEQKTPPREGTFGWYMGCTTALIFDNDEDKFREKLGCDGAKTAALKTPLTDDQSGGTKR